MLKRVDIRPNYVVCGLWLCRFFGRLVLRLVLFVVLFVLLTGICRRGCVMHGLNFMTWLLFWLISMFHVLWELDVIFTQELFPRAVCWSLLDLVLRTQILRQSWERRGIGLGVEDASFCFSGSLYPRKCTIPRSVPLCLDSERVRAPWNLRVLVWRHDDSRTAGGFISLTSVQYS